MKNRFTSKIDKNKIVDQGDGVIVFKGGLTLSDESVQRNGTRYDIASMDLSQYDGTVFADHDYSITAIVGKAIGVAKKSKKLVAEGVQFAIEESSLARYVYDMVKAGYINAVSIGSMGELDEEGVYQNAQLLEFSFVGIGNNMNAKIAKQALEESKVNGVDTQELEDFMQNALVEEGEKENQQEEKEEEQMEETKTVETKVETEVKTETPAPDQNAAVLDAISKIAASVSGLAEKVEKVEKNAFDKAATEPEFKSGDNKTPVAPSAQNALANMGWQDRTQLQIKNFWEATKNGSSEARKQLDEINKFHKDALIKEGLVKNTLTMTDFGSFVTSPEMLTEIQGYRSDYSELLNAFPYRQTNSLQMAWLTRTGDIDMTSVEMCDDGADGNLKPISEYGADSHTKNLEEMAAVTPVCTAATIFMAADLLEDAAAGYRMSYDRNKARAIIAALEKAAEDNDDASFAESGDLDDAAGANAWLSDVRKAIFAISQGNGVLVMNEATFGVIWNALLLTGNGGMLTNTVNGSAVNKQLWEKRFVVVPNDLMPTIGETSTYKTYEYEGANVTINHAIFYVNPSNVRARENGGLRYDLSTEAAYEVNGVVKSAYQRNEIVLRGSHFRGTAVLDVTRVGAVRAGAVIS